ncbi:membrane protein [Kribbella voronezhensis]|uniref:Membrane protein n=1 Tax=Kribbella voronezhensis TaxID=2512212 RepID=A0A4R7T0G8_9ACTN|nr:YihY/virulence factor BrkB family protein [Kribbella voronezhensis]TDU84526.1 membrane protein [Kribbella voronezhensis]
MARSGSETSVSLAWARRIPATTWKLITQTVGTCLRYRVTGLAAEAAFFAILSLPPLIFGLAGSIGFIAGKYFEVETIDSIKVQIAELASRALTADSINSVIVPTIDKVLDGGRPDVISIGFVLSLWSGSRALNVFVDTITIMYGMGGKRGIIRTRALSFSLYCGALVIGVIVLPLVLAGPDAVDALLPQKVDFLNQLYWPVVTILSAGFLNTLFHLSVPVRTPWMSDLPGSFLTLSIWIVGSFVLRWILQSTVGGTSIYGPLAAPIAVLMWLYMTAIAVLIGAALNAVVDRLWPHKSRKELEEPEEVQEPVMKAEPDPHHVDVVVPGEQRPEIEMARAVEALGGAEEVEEQAASARKLPDIAKAPSSPHDETPAEANAKQSHDETPTEANAKQSHDETPTEANAKQSHDETPTEANAKRSRAVDPNTAADAERSRAGDENGVVEEAPAGRKAAAMASPGKPAPVVPEGAEREPERVGKSGAQAEGDDIR